MDNVRTDLDSVKAYYRRFLDGDKEAFREIIAEYRSNLLFFVNGLIHNLSDSEDIVEDSFFDLITHPNRYNFSVSLKTYLFTIARNKAVDYIKHRSRHISVPLDEYAEITDEYASFEEDFNKNERNRTLHMAMGKLNGDYQTVLYLFYFEDMGYDDAGRVMKKNKKQIENLLHRARNALRTELEREGFEYEDQ